MFLNGARSSLLRRFKASDGASDSQAIERFRLMTSGMVDASGDVVRMGAAASAIMPSNSASNIERSFESRCSGFMLAMDMEMTVEHARAVFVCLNLLSLLLRLLSVARSSLESLGSQALVHVAFDVTAHAHSLPQEALSMAFVKSHTNQAGPFHDNQNYKGSHGNLLLRISPTVRVLRASL
ncbi:hypothetical protein KC323_g112 [Hortaea werneckii]|nr:hypothetical protein KC323_g112 [Hortaea werneckii]